MTDVVHTSSDLAAVTVSVYATIDGSQVSARWSGGSVAGDTRLCDGLEGPLDDPLEFINACEAVVGGPVGVAIGPLARGSGEDRLG